MKWEVLAAYFESEIVTKAAFEKLITKTLNMPTLPVDLTREQFSSVMIAFERLVEEQERVIEESE